MKKLLKNSKSLRNLKVGSRVDLVTEQSSHMFTNRNCIVSKVTEDEVHLNYGNGKYKLQFDKLAFYVDGTISTISVDTFKLYLQDYMTRDEMINLKSGDKVMMTHDLYTESKYSHLRNKKRIISILFTKFYPDSSKYVITYSVDDVKHPMTINVSNLNSAGCLRLYDKNSTGGAVGVINFTKLN